MLLGMKKEEIERKLESIIKFADIRQFIDVPLYTYSSGMKLRLGFAIAFVSNPDIIILDECLNVGDIKFKKKVKRKLDGILKHKTIIVVSHYLMDIKYFSNHIILLRNGKIYLGENILTTYNKSKY